MWTQGILLPHAPILVPEVAGRSGSGPGKTLNAFLSVRKRLTEAAPDMLLVLDPHTSTERTFSLIQSGSFSGDLGQFGARSVSVKSNGGPAEEGAALSRHIANLFPVEHFQPETYVLDYGAVVPLHFLKLALGSTPPFVIANPVTISFTQAYQLGKHLREYGTKINWGLLASGDLSHRLSRDAPSGYHPDGKILDDAIQQALISSSPAPIFDLDPDTIYNAGECGLRSVLALLGLSLGAGVELLSYEAPFGVGYCSAVWFEGGICPNEQG
jgi:aromatic ring-opening dioxygenase LigB subunit